MHPAIDANADLNQYHIADLLVNAHCPVYLVSKNIEATENVILTYDGSFSAIHAIKMYTYLFPELHNLQAYLLYITTDEKAGLPKETNIKNWISGRYNNLQVKILNGSVDDELINYTKSLTNSLVVMGSFGRSVVSRFFHKSLANAVIEEGRASLFIAHK